MVARLAEKGKLKNGFLKVSLFYILYLLVVAIVSFMGFFDTVMLPPKIVFTTTLPLAIFVTILYNTRIFKKANAILRLETLVGIHIFRLIGSTFLVLLYYKLLPSTFAVFAGVGDVLTAISSILIVKIIRAKKSYAQRVTYLWNIFGLVDILITSAMAIIFTKISIDTDSMGVEFLAKFPFCFIPAFAPPTIIFLHLLIFRKLKWLKKT